MVNLTRTGTPAEAFKLTREYPPDAMRIVQEGSEKEDQLIVG